MHTPATRELMRTQVQALLLALIADNIDFRLVIHNHDDWDFPLPPKLMEQFPDQLPIDITKEVIEHITFEGENVVLKMMFGDDEYNRVIFPNDILAIADPKNNQPLMVLNFPPEPDTEAPKVVEASRVITSKAEWLEETVVDGIQKEAAIVSINAFMKNNPELVERLS